MTSDYDQPLFEMADNPVSRFAEPRVRPVEFLAPSAADHPFTPELGADVLNFITGVPMAVSPLAYQALFAPAGQAPPPQNRVLQQIEEMRARGIPSPNY